jgi:uncharacterized protein YceK
MVVKKLALGLAMCAGLTALAIFVLTGCGTLTNLDAKQTPSNDSVPGSQLRPYGGVVIDVKGALGSPHIGTDYVAILPPLLWLDLPLSFIGDTVTLPYVLLRLITIDSTGNHKSTKEDAIQRIPGN